MRVASLAVLAAALSSAATVQAQSPRFASFAAAGRPPAVRTIAPQIRFVSEGNRLALAGRVDSVAVQRQLLDDAERAGLTVADANQADAALDAVFVCAGPNQGPVGCSVELRLLSLDHTPEGAVAGYQIWGSSRSVFRRDGWAQMGASASAMAAEVGEELVNALAGSATRVSFAAPLPTR